MSATDTGGKNQGEVTIVRTRPVVVQKVQKCVRVPATLVVPPLLTPREEFSHGFKLGVNAMRHFTRNLQRAVNMGNVTNRVISGVVDHVLGLGK